MEQCGVGWEMKVGVDIYDSGRDFQHKFTWTSYVVKG